MRAAAPLKGQPHPEPGWALPQTPVGSAAMHHHGRPAACQYKRRVLRSELMCLISSDARGDSTGRPTPS